VRRVVREVLHERASERLAGSGGIPEPAVHHTEAVLHQRLGLVEVADLLLVRRAHLLQRLRQLGERGVGIAELKEQSAAVGVKPGVVTRPLDGLRVEGQRLREVSPGVGVPRAYRGRRRLDVRVEVVLDLGG